MDPARPQPAATRRPCLAARGSCGHSRAAVKLCSRKRLWAALLTWHDKGGQCRPTTRGLVPNCAKSHEMSPNNGAQSPHVFDKVGTLDRWVERSEAPASVAASRTTDGKVDRTRPLCPHPQVAICQGRIASTTPRASCVSCGEEGSGRRQHCCRSGDVRHRRTPCAILHSWLRLYSIATWYGCTTITFPSGNRTVAGRSS